jgi:hypothetical protein
LKHLVELKLTNAVPTILAYVKAHSGQWSKEHLETLVAFHATCAAPLMAELFAAEHDKVRSDSRNGTSSATRSFVGWAKQQVADAAACR